MRIETINSDFNSSDVFNDLINAGRIDNWIMNIIKHRCDFKPLELTLNIDDEKKKIIEYGVFSDDANDYGIALQNKKDVRLSFPNDKLDIFINFKTKSVTINIFN